MYKSAVHAVELAYVFNNLEDEIISGTVDPGTAARAQEAWVNFAKTGDPSIEGVEWKPYHSDTRDTMVIEKDKWECVSECTFTCLSPRNAHFRWVLPQTVAEDPFFAHGRREEEISKGKKVHLPDQNLPFTTSRENDIMKMRLSSHIKKGEFYESIDHR